MKMTCPSICENKHVSQIAVDRWFLKYLFQWMVNFSNSQIRF
jgi:hypothetical protein